MHHMIHVAVRGFTMLWVLRATAVIGNAIALDISAAPSARAAVNFSMFALVLAWLAGIYGIAWAVWPSLLRPAVAVALDGLTVLFSFLAAVVLSAKLGAVNCAHLVDTDLAPDYIALGSADLQKRCSEIQAGAVFLWFILVGFVVSLVISVREARAGHGGL